MPGKRRNLTESEQVLEWMAQGEAQGALQARREDLRMVLEVRFGPLPVDLLQRIEAITDSERLLTAIRKVYHLQSLADLQL